MLYFKPLILLIMVVSTNSVFGQSKIGLFDNHIVVGNTDLIGTAHYHEEDQTYTIGSGNMELGEDQFHYLWTTIQGDFILRAEIEFPDFVTNPRAKVGWMVKNDLDPETPHVSATIQGNGLTSLQCRQSVNGDITKITSTDKQPQVIQLERNGHKFIMSSAQFGKELTQITLDSMALDKHAYVGLYVTANNPQALNEVKFRNVRIVQPVSDDLVPYQDYLGSHLEIMDVATGHRKIVHSTDYSLQAPNWTPDGKRLIYNSEGRLYNYHLNDGRITPFNTGFATNNNNDHVLTFDGTLMGISHHNSHDENRSTLYYLPAEGHANPVVVTKPGVGASYLHGWSPDNQKMIFTGNRNGQYDIYTVDKQTGQEHQLTNQPTLDDGPEYSPDGRYIYFNSVRTGVMQLWRMDTDGKNKTQLTFDDYNDWFPHVSPDQKWIVFISFPKDIDPSSHPFYKRCLLRIMPFDGGTPKVIGYIYGGQGTINVPSWSPDSKYIAFVTNSGF